MDLPQGTVHITDSTGHSSQETFDLIVGADGRRSKVREAMQANDPRMTVDVVPGWRSYKSFKDLPATGNAELCKAAWLPCNELKLAGILVLGQVHARMCVCVCVCACV